MLLVFTRQGTKVTAQVTKDGELVGRITSKFSDAAHFSRAASELQLDRKEFTRCLQAFEAGDLSEFDFTQRFRLRVRPLLGNEEKTLEIEDPVSALLTACRTSWEFDDPIALWDSLEDLAAVDLDSKNWNDTRLQDLLREFQPQPCLSWVTKSGGLRLIYGKDQRLSAEEAASVAYLHLFSTEEFNSLEIKKDTRLPAGFVRETEQTSDYSLLRRWLHDYSVDDEEVRKWLAESGLEVGKSYEHSKCPVQPSTTAKGCPVIVYRDGIKCFVCEAHGIERTSRPGWFPFSAFVGSTASTAVHNCVAGFCHWEHAKHVIESKIGMSGSAAKLVYSAMLKLNHPDLECTKSVFDIGRDLLRIEGMWTNANGEPYTKSIRDVLVTLPAATGLNGKAHPSKVALLEQTFDLSSYGYPSLIAIFGMKLCKQTAARDVQIVVQTPSLARDDAAEYRPRYVTNRIPDPWKLIEEACPGINRSYVKLLIVARGYSEAQVGMPPMIFVSGPTSSAKTGTIKVAASIVGDSVSEHVWTDNVDRIRQAIRDAKNSGTYVVFNEFFKEAQRLNQSAVQAADFILNLTPDSMSWKAYVGPVRLGCLPVFVWTDTHVPGELKADAQLARRLVHIHLPVQVDWRDSLTRTIGQVQNLRVHSKEHAEACNSIVSDVIDEFFCSVTTFEEAAKRLGYAIMAESQEADEAKLALVAFFRAVCDAPEISAADASRWGGRGWKLVQRGQETPLSQAWDTVRDESWTSSRKCSEVDWMKLAGLQVPVQFELRAHGSRLVIRFKSSGRASYEVNEELLTK